MSFCESLGSPEGPRDAFLEGSDSSPNSSSERSDSPESSPFRGFFKVPRVILTRLNLDTLENNEPASQTEVPRNETTYRSYENTPFLHNCSVKLVRDNLEQLKKDILRNSRINTRNKNLNMMLRCKICEKAYSSEKKLQNHQENKHMLVYRSSNKPQKRVSFSDHIIVHELREYHRCRKCTKIFEDYQSLKQHMKQKHKKRKCYICHYCSKNFVDRMFFKVHIKLHCDVCGALFPSKSEYLVHRREACRIMKKYKCKTCDTSFFSYMDLKDHSYEHLETVFICDICKEQLPSRCAVAHHILFLHSEKRPRALYAIQNIGNEKLYLCNSCEHTSVDREMIENHVAVLPDLKNRERTDYKDYYFCDQCSKKFDSETSMLQHKWSHFLNTTDNPQAESEVEEKSGFKRIYKMNEKLPVLMQPKIMLERLECKQHTPLASPLHADSPNSSLNGEINIKKAIVDPKYADSPNSSLNGEINIKKAIVDPKSKKTLLSRHQCNKCNKFFSSNYCLNRHIVQVHDDYSHLRCNDCEETFVWPSLLKTHKCIRMNIPEMPFDDARPEIQLTNDYSDFGQCGFDELMTMDYSEDNYMQAVDFEIPAPIVELIEYENCAVNTMNNNLNQNGFGPNNSYNHNGYKIVMQEVPIEF